MPSGAPYCVLAGFFFARASFGAEPFPEGKKTPVLKLQKSALFDYPGSNIVPNESGHFAGFSGIARIGKPGVLRGFQGLYSVFGKNHRVTRVQKIFDEYLWVIRQENTGQVQDFCIRLCGKGRCVKRNP